MKLYCTIVRSAATHCCIGVTVVSLVLSACRRRRPGPHVSHQHFSVLVAEGRPDGAGFQAAAVLAKAGVPVTVVLDSAVGYHMEVADLCVTGAEGVLENGGIVNKVGFGSGVGMLSGTDSFL